MNKNVRTKKRYFYKRLKNGKKRISRRYKIKENRKNKMIGGNLNEIRALDSSKQTIILIGEQHINREKDIVEYYQIIRKQREIIDLCIDIFGEDETCFYSEAPEGQKELVLRDDIISSSVVVQYAATKIPTKFSRVNWLDRNEGNSDDKYCDDILSVLDRYPNFKCIIVAIGILHILELKRYIMYSVVPTTQIIIVNTAPEKQLTLMKNNPSLIELITTEKPYELPPSIQDIADIRAELKSERTYNLFF